jgi:ABC-type bacteriocin/lantibiotic exporter with double-glycine peptidase domain
MTTRDFYQPDTNGPRADRGGTVLATYRKLLRLLKPGLRAEAGILVAAYMADLGRIAASTCAPLCLAAILDKALPAQDLHLFSLYTAGILASFVAFLGFSLLKSYFLGRSVERVFLNLRTRLVTSVIKKPARFFKEHEMGDVITRASSDTDLLSVLVLDYIFPSVDHLTTVVVLSIIMLVWHWQLGLYITLALPCFVFVILLFQKPLARLARTAREKLSEQNETMLDILGGIKEMRFYQQTQEGSQRFSGSAERFTAANIRSVVMGDGTYHSMEFFSRLITFIPFLLGGYWICKGSTSLSVGTLIAYNVYLSFIAYSLQSVIFGMTKLIQASPLMRRIGEVLNYPEEEIKPVAGIREIVGSTRIEYRGVSFSHVPGNPVLRDFCLTVDPGEKVAIMGPSGAGKSTVIDLLTRHIEPDEGEILLDGRSIHTFSLPYYLLNFSYVRQSPYLFRTTVRDNIGAGWYSVPPDVIIDVAKRVQIHDSIMRMPDGYDTIIGADGTDLSGGQRQRIALARALVRDPAILLLDEFTSALDPATEQQILDDLLSTFQKQTVICVTHSRAVANRFSRIVSLEKH